MALHPGDRIQLKKRIAQTLAQQDWDDIDLTLSEFGFPTTDLWDGGADDRRGYVIQMLAGSNDDVLSQLDDYLHPTAVEPATPQPESFEDPRNPWSGDGFKLFISHVHGYAAHAGALRTELGRRSVDGFVAHDSIEPTEDWQDVIRYALASCEGCVALLTAGFRESPWTDQEVGWCMGRGVLVVPVEFGLNPYGLLGRYQAFRVKKGQTPADIALGIFELLVRKPESREAMARAGG
ncbi:MAG: TIR domain-containing protein [Solirubrobacterales bacterium]